MFSGTRDEPIVLEPLASNNKGIWQGMVVMNSPEKSAFKYVTIKNTAGINQPGWKLTGGINYYKSDVNIENCTFQDNAGEDALNIIHSRFEITDTRFINTASDAFDSDFSDGVFTNGEFINIGLLGGGDGIDVSGSNIKVIGTTFKDVSDKALSVGEASKMNVSNVNIISAGTGAASKDGSTLTISNSKISNVQTVGLMAYIKKPEYGAATISAKQISFAESVTPARAQKGSSIMIDGVSIESENINVKEMYRTIMKPGLAK